jgi:hypothetical protein
MTDEASCSALTLPLNQQSEVVQCITALVGHVHADVILSLDHNWKKAPGRPTRDQARGREQAWERRSEVRQQVGARVAPAVLNSKPVPRMRSSCVKLSCLQSAEGGVFVWVGEAGTAGGRYVDIKCSCGAEKQLNVEASFHVEARSFSSIPVHCLDAHFFSHASRTVQPHSTGTEKHRRRT